MKMRLYLLVFLSFLSSCASIPEIENKKVLDTLVGQPAIQVLRNFGTPTGHYQISGHLFLSYKTTETSYSPGIGGFDTIGTGFDGWDGGFDGGFYGPEIPPSYYSSTCQTTFEVVKKKVVAWRMRGDC